ncbi:ATP-binding protein [Helicobacter pylori]|nr:ATP-binding protein [Helicobacter pylori]
MIDAGNLLKELDDALDKVVPKKRATELSQADRLTNRGLSKEYQANSSAIHRRAKVQ